VREAKSASAEETFPKDLDDLSAMRQALARLSEGVSRRLRRDGAKARTLTLKVRFGSFRTITRQVSLRVPTDQVDTIRRKACELLDTVERREEGVRLLGVRATNLVRTPGQLSLFDEKAQRRGQLERTLVYLHKRFGPDAVRWARESTESR
jgi:DNA polymerase-4